MNKNDELYAGLSDEEKAFYDEMYDREKSSVERRKKIPEHKWNRDGVGKHYCNILFIPGSKEEAFGGKIDLPKKLLVHKNICTWDQKTKTRGGLFPQAKEWSVLHHGDDSQCLVCRKLVTVEKQLEVATHSGNDELVKKLSRLLQSRPRYRRVWIGVTHTKEPGANPWEKVIQVWEMAEYSWIKSIESQILKAKKIDIDEWTEQNMDELNGLSEKEIKVQYNIQAPSAYSAPWDMHKGFKIRIIKEGSFVDLSWDVTKLEAWPYFPVKMPSKINSKHPQFEKMKKLVDLSTENFEWIREQFKLGVVPTVEDKYVPIKSLDEQAEFLGISSGDEIKDTDSQEMVANKLESMEDLDLDSLDEKVETSIEDDSEDDDSDDLDLDSLEDDLPF